MELNPNKTPIEVFKEGAFGRTYFKDIYSGVNGKWYRNLWKEINELKNTDQKVYCSDYYDAELNKYKVKTETSLRFWENKIWINETDSYGWLEWYFRYFLGRRSSGDFRQIKRWKKIVSTFKGKLVKVIKDSSGKFDDYSISPKIRQILLHWGYELKKEEIFIIFIILFHCIKDEVLSI